MAQDRPEETPREQAEQPPEEHFSDVFWSHVNPWSCVLDFGHRSVNTQEKATPLVRVRMPLQQAKALAVILLRSIRRYEEQHGVEVELPRQVLEALNIPPEDWQRFKGS